MLSIELQKLKTSLGEVIQEWITDQTQKDEDWNDLDTLVSDDIAPLMAEAAFTVLLSQKSLTEYYTREDLLK